MKKLILLAAVLIFSAAHANAGIVGNTVNATYYFPNASSPYSPYGDISNAVVGSGIEFSGESSFYPYSYFDVDLSDTGVTITFLNDAPYTGGNTYPWESIITFNGLKLTNLTKDFEPSELSPLSHSFRSFDWTGNTLSFNWQGIHFSAGDQIIVVTTATTVPEPASLALLCLGLAGLVFSRRKKA